jgi:hypothetical protein
MFTRLLAVLVLTLTATHAHAQPLADHVPADAVLYVGWRGADDPDAGYAGSNLQTVAEASELPQVLSQTLDVIKRTNPGDPGAALFADMARTVGFASWSRPTAAYLQQADDPQLPVRFVIHWQAEGQAADDLQASLTQLAARAQPGSPLDVGRAGDLVTLTIGAPVVDPAAVAAPLAAAPRFTQALSHASADGVVVAYLDGRGLLALIDRLSETESPREHEQWLLVRDAMGLGGLNAAVWTAGFEGKDWRTDLFIDAPAPRTGVLSLLDCEPLTDEILADIPAEATWFMATRTDLGVLLDEVKGVIGEIDANSAAKLDEMLVQVGEMTGVDIEGDLIRALGSAWVFYTDPGATGSGILGLCMVNTLKDAEAVNRSLVSLQAIANAFMGQAGAGAGMRIRFHTAEHEGMTLHTLGIPFVAPTWSVHDGRLYAGLYRQVVTTAADRARAGGPSVLDSDSYRATLDRLGAESANSIVYTDLPRTAEGSYQNLVMLSQIASGFIAMFGADASPALLPPFARIEPVLSPAAQVSWTDDAGFHLRSISPFPGSSLLGPQGGTNMTTMSGPMLVGILLPALGSARQSARQVQSMSNLRQVLVAMHNYAADHDRTFPTQTGDLIRLGYLPDPAVFVSPASGKQPPWNFGELDEARQARWVRENSSYILIPVVGGFDDVPQPATHILLFERPEDAANPGKIALGYADGHAEMREAWEAFELIEAQTGMTIDQLIAQQVNPEPAVQEQAQP